MATADPRTFVLVSFRFLSYISFYQLHKSIPGLTLLVESASLFMWTGRSFSTSQKMLDYAKLGHLDEHPVSRISYRYIKKMHEFMIGKWEVDDDYDGFFRKNIELGKIWSLTIYTFFTAMGQIELGNFSGFIDSTEKLDEIHGSFENRHAKAQMFRTLTCGLYRFRKMDEAIETAEKGIAYTIATGHNAMLLVLYCYKSQTHSLKGQMNEAEQALFEAGKLIKHHKVITIYHCSYLLAKVRMELARLQLMDIADRNFKHQLKKVLKTSDTLISKSKKMAGSLTESYLIRSELYRFLKKDDKALKYLVKAVETGERFNGRLELSRAYFEMGKLLSSPDIKRDRFKGLSAGEYLDKARAMFEEMGLEWDLEQFKVQGSKWRRESYSRKSLVVSR